MYFLATHDQTPLFDRPYLIIAIGRYHFDLLQWLHAPAQIAQKVQGAKRRFETQNLFFSRYRRSLPPALICLANPSEPTSFYLPVLAKPIGRAP